MTFNDDSRHYGKTALLNWFKAACEDRRLDAVALTPDEIPNRTALVAALSPRTWGSKLLARLAARKALHRLGYVWRPPGRLPPVTWSAGISSLMAQVFDHAKPSAPERAHP